MRNFERLAAALTFATLISPAAMAQSATSFAIIAPPANVIVQMQAPLGIKWLGANNASGVELALIDDTNNAVLPIANNIPNNGTFTWTMPPFVPCGRPVHIRIAGNIPQPFGGAKRIENHGPRFTIACNQPTLQYDLRLSKTRQGNTYTLVVQNAAANLAAGTRFTILDQVPAGMTISNPVLNGWVCAASFPLTGPRPVSCTFASGPLPNAGQLPPLSFTASGTWQQPNCADLSVQINNSPIAETTMANNRACVP